MEGEAGGAARRVIPLPPSKRFLHLGPQRNGYCPRHSPAWFLARTRAQRSRPVARRRSRQAG